MSDRFNAIAHTLRSSLRRLRRPARGFANEAGRNKRRLIALAVAALGVGYVVTHPPFGAVEAGDVGIRTNLLTGSTTEFRAGSVLVMPGLHQLRTLPLRTQIYRPEGSSKADGPSPFQSVEGLSLGMDITVRYSLDPQKLATIARNLPDDIEGQVVGPVVQGVMYKTLSRYTVREIFSTKRAEIQQVMEAELKPRLAADGIQLGALQIGKVDLPRDYRVGMEKLLIEELESEKMRYTLELKDKQVKQTALEAAAEKVRRETAAEAAGQEQIIAAKAQAEAMKHVLPFKEKQIEQRGLEAEADKVSRIKSAEANAQARRIEAAGEADSRQKLADAEVYRQERIGKVASEQLARDGALIQKNPLLIQKTMADKLADKIQVIIAPTPTDGSFIGNALLGAGKGNLQAAVASQPAEQAVEGAE
ncbi:hypothetical protein GCM10025771_11600 [Niveibacterium umoris]|uniref:Regulator of protease activity HflC (Stomatin/prohibitin superfamily) n=1 Tax=Niveibacterium umoris TaxID=1193620 RepID=A0A840BSC8_9RHOO|nr:SPFH domain-containing protein [Niveibacterium umoris]MBB4013287.1 regulator of protease activity HflC (stomatin/prohibitin superfamily) [Niveibacterium umoris]